MPTGRRSSKRPYGKPHEELDVERVRGGGPRIERGPGGEDYYVATPRPNDKTYVCPGCQQEIPGDTVHVVAWAADGLFGPEAAQSARRHWHTHCWRTFGRVNG